MVVCVSVLTFVSSTQLPSRMLTLYPGLMTSWMLSMGQNGTLLWTLRVDIGRCLSQSRTRRRPRFEPATGSCLSSTRSPLVSAMHLPPFPASWIEYWPASIGRRAYSISITLLSFPPHGRNTSLGSAVFERLRHAKLKLEAAKCTFAAKEVSYLGHSVTEEGLLPDPSLLAAIRDIPPPKTATEVRSFLGLAGYYRRYVKGFAAIAAPLHALTRKDAVFHWSEDCQNAFDQLKARLTTSPITAFPDFSQEFRLYTDASTAGLGAILTQVREGKERIICCASRALNKAEKSYPATKLECLAIVWAVAKFRPYLMAMPFEVFTDHYAL